MKSYLIAALPFLIIFAGLFTVITMLSNNRKTSATNVTYIRVQTCILSINAVNRSQAQIEKCWQLVEADTGVHPYRYDLEAKK